MSRRPRPAPAGSPQDDDAVWRADHDRVRGPAPRPQPEPYGGDQGAVHDEPADDDPDPADH